MNDDHAFGPDDLTVLLSLDLTEPTDRADIATIDAIIARRRAQDFAGADRNQNRNRSRVALHLVPDSPS